MYNPWWSIGGCKPPRPIDQSAGIMIDSWAGEGLASGRALGEFGRNSDGPHSLMASSGSAGKFRYRWPELYISLQLEGEHIYTCKPVTRTLLAPHRTFEEK